MHPTRTIFRTVVLLAVLVAGGATASAQGPFGSLLVAANRSQYTGPGCPIEVIYTANVNFLTPHGGLSFNYHWERSDGAKGPVEVVRVVPNQRMMVIHTGWRVGAPGRHYQVSETIFVNSGYTHLTHSSRVVTINCR